MSDYTVDQALAEVQSLVFCRCHPSYKERGMHDPNCDCDGAGAVQVVTARLADLEAELREARMQSLADLGQAQMAREAQLEAEAKLAKAVEALQNIDCKLTNMQPKIANGLLNEVQLAWVDQYVDPCICEARATLKELGGKADE